MNSPVDNGCDESRVPPVWNVGDLILGLYEVKGIHEGGGMGLVYRVFHRGWNLDLAVKSPRAEFFETDRQKEDFRRECETWVSLGLHPNVVSCYYVRNLGNIPRIFVEYVEGGTLRDWIDSRKLYEGGPEEALRRMLDIAIQMAWGLHYAHEQGVIHQDVKPANVLMTPDGTAKVTDFGLAKARAATNETTSSGRARTILVSSGGMTPAYCSPEQARKEPLTRQSDIWSWAVSVLEMFVGEACWTSGVVAPEVLRQLGELRAPGVTLPDLPQELRGFLLMCFESDAARRPRDAQEVSGRLAEIYGDQLNEEHVRSEPAAAEQRGDALNNRALSLLDLGKPPEALRAFDQALVLEPCHPECLYNRGLLLWRLAGLTDQQLLKMLREAALQPDKAVRCNYAIGLVHLEQGDGEAAVKALKAAQTEAPASVEIAAALERAVETARVQAAIRTFEGHPGGVESVALSPDGRWVLSGGGGRPFSDRTLSPRALRLWDVANGRCVQGWEGHTDNVTSVAISCDGRWAVSGSYDATVRLWKMRSGRCVRTLRGHFGFVNAVAVSQSGDWALSGGDDGTVRLWELASGRCMRTLEGHANVKSVAVSSDALWVLSTSTDKTVRLWEVASGHCVRTLEGHSDVVNSVVLSGDCRHALSGSRDGTLRLWELVTGRCLRAFEGHIHSVNSVALSGDGCWALSGGGGYVDMDNTVRLWEVATGRCARTFEAHKSWVSSVAFSSDGRFGVSGSRDGSLRIWDLSAPSPSPWVVARPIASSQQVSQGSRFRASLELAQEHLNHREWRRAASAAREALACKGYGQAAEALHMGVGWWAPSAELRWTREGTDVGEHDARWPKGAVGKHG